MYGDLPEPTFKIGAGNLHDGLLFHELYKKIYVYDEYIVVWQKSIRLYR